MVLFPNSDVAMHCIRCFRDGEGSGVQVTEGVWTNKDKVRSQVSLVGFGTRQANDGTGSLGGRLATGDVRRRTCTFYLPSR